MKKAPKYVVVREKKKNAKAAFEAYKNVVFQDGNVPQSISNAPAPVAKKEETRPSGSKPSAKYPDFYKPKTGVGIVDIYQSESSNEDDGMNVLRVELTDGTVREFKVKNGSKGEEGCTGLGGIRGPRGAVGAQGPKGDKGDKGDRGEQGPQGIQGPQGDSGDATMADIVSVSEALQTTYSYILQGRNLLRDTNKGVTGWNYKQYQGAEYTLEEYGKGMKLTLTKAPTEWNYLSFNIQKALPRIKPNTMYVLSFDLTCNATNGISLQIVRGNATGIIADGGWIYHKGDDVAEHMAIPLKTSDFTEALDEQVLYIGVPSVSGVCLAIENLKLEQGYNSTPWCPAPEDAIEGFPELTEATAKAFDVVEQYVVDHPKEEWITIADTTLTEEIKKLEFSTDVNGIPFECKKVICHVILPEKTSAIWGICWGRYGWHAYCSITEGTIGFIVTAEVELNKFARYTKAQINAGTHYVTDFGYGDLVRADETTCYDTLLNHFVVEEYGNYMFPVGTQIKIWGLKA